MKLQEAKELIAFEISPSTPQLWLDLGCGSGLFTSALAHFLPGASRIVAVDRDRKALEQLPACISHVVVEKLHADFIHEPLPLNNADGILMANSLHYVKDKKMFLHRLDSRLPPGSVFLLVEYNRSRANAWVPYPLTIEEAKELFQNAGREYFQVLNTRTSAYGGEMYAALIR